MCALKAKKIDLPKFPANMKKRKSKRPGSFVDNLMENPHLLYEDLQRYREEEWWKRVKAFEANPDSVYNAYWYVALHPMFYSFHPWKNHRKDGVPAVHERHLDHESGWKYARITPHMVNPKDRRISDDEHLNTKIEWWYEFGPTLWDNDYGRGCSGMDHKLMGGARTYDEAIVKVAKAIHRGYGNDRKQVVKKWKDPELPTEG